MVRHNLGPCFTTPSVFNPSISHESVSAIGKTLIYASKTLTHEDLSQRHSSDNSNADDRRHAPRGGITQRRSSRLPLQSGMQLSARSSLNAPQPTAGDEGLRTIKIVREESSSRAQVELCRCSSVLFDADHSEQTTIPCRRHLVCQWRRCGNAVALTLGSVYT